MVALLLAAVAVGLSNLAAAVGIGATGVDRTARIRVAVIFFLLEAGMPIIGLLLGHGLASDIGRQTRWLAAALLVGLGAYGIVKAGRGAAASHASSAKPATSVEPARSAQPLRLLITGLALSADNLVVGFALGSYQVSVAAGAIVFGIVSTVMSLIGLEVGARLGRQAGERGEIIGGVVLVGVGVAIGLGALG